MQLTYQKQKVFCVAQKEDKIITNQRSIRSDPTEKDSK